MPMIHEPETSIREALQRAELVTMRGQLQDRIIELESLTARLADALAHTCDRLERCDARLLRLTKQPCEGPLGEVARGRALVDEACVSQLRGQR